MLTYHITIGLSNGESLKFDVSAATTGQARKFGLSTGQSMIKSKGIRAKIVCIDVDDFYDVYDDC